MRSHVLITLLAVPTVFGCMGAERGREYLLREHLKREHHKRQDAPPLTAITSGAAPEPTVALNSVPTAGAAGPYDGAPALPDISSFNIANYPAFLEIPPTDSPEVKGWIAEVAASGIEIPTWAPNVAPDCDKNPEALADASRCWWTCQGCSADDDIQTCPDKMTWGLTFDDGPSPQSPRLLNWLESVNQKATFYLIGSNVMQYPDIVRHEYVAGHELSSHTWSHHALTTLTTEQIIAELGWTRKVIKDVTGVAPKTFRPPQGDMDNRVRAIARAMGLSPVVWTDDAPSFDSGDWRVVAGEFDGQTSFDNFQKALDSAPNRPTGFISLEHDVHPQTVDIAFHILPAAMGTSKYDIKPVMECLNQPLSAAYEETSGGSSSPADGSDSPSSSSSSGSRAAASSTSNTRTSTRSSSTSSASTQAQQGGNSASRSGYSLLAVLLSAIAGGFMVL